MYYSELKAIDLEYITIVADRVHHVIANLTRNGHNENCAAIDFINKNRRTVDVRLFHPNKQDLDRFNKEFLNSKKILAIGIYGMNITNVPECVNEFKVNTRSRKTKKIGEHLIKIDRISSSNHNSHSVHINTMPFEGDPNRWSVSGFGLDAPIPVF